MMASESREFNAYQQVLEQHRALEELLAEIEDALEGQATTIAEVADLLGRLGDRLVKHFASEEEGGYFAEALTHAPRLVARANALMAQHPKMTRSAQELAEVSEPEAARREWLPETRERFKAFLLELRWHERQEDELLQEAFNRDLGAND